MRSLNLSTVPSHVNYLIPSLLSDGEIDLQRHEHTHTCYKRKSFRRCRFGIPYPPMVQTQILEPLDFNANTASKEEIAQNKSLKETAIKIYTLIDNFDKGDTNLNIISIEDFLQNLSLTHDEYIIALRSCLKRPTVFLQRNVCLAEFAGMYDFQSNEKF